MATIVGLIILFWLVVIGVIIFLIVYLVKYNDKQKDQSREDTPLEILKERYAKGEINKEEFEDKKKELEK